MGYKEWAVGEEALAADVNAYLARQVVNTFPNTAARDTWAAPPNGAMCVTLDTGTLWIRYAGAWQAYKEGLYSQITAPVTITATTSGAAQNVINPGSRTYDGSPIILEFFSDHVQTPSGASAQIRLTLWDENTELGTFGQIIAATGVTGVPMFLRRRLTPTAGPHNYNIRAWVTGTSGLVSAGTGATTGDHQPAYLRVTRAL